ncbi:MAG: hypothetical protein PWQ79_157 [Thermococcaceae archaeon]|nr:hypothetical protein [Thermococcaceae archaeon]
MVELLVDSLLVDSKPVNVSTSGASVALHWVAVQGEHSYEVRLFEVLGGQELEVDEWSGEVSVARVLNGLSAWLEVVPNPVEAGNNVTVYITVKNSENYKQTLPIELVDDTGNVWWPKEGYHGVGYSISDGYLTIYANKTARIIATIGPITQNTTLKLKIGEYSMASEYIEVTQTKVQKAVMDCSDLQLLAKEGNLVLDMECVVYFTNPTDVQWEITSINANAHILKTRYTKDLTPEFTPPTILTKTVPAGGVGEFELKFHDVLPEKGIIESGIEIKKLSGVTVPVQVNFTVLVNGQPYVIDSKGKIWGLSYEATKYVTIRVDSDKVIEHLVISMAVGFGAGVATAYILKCTKIGATIGSAVPGGGTLIGAAVGFITYKVLGLP